MFLTKQIMTKVFKLIGFLLWLPLGLNAQSAADEIKKIMNSQAECWSSGDIDCFMSGYWQHPDLTFIGKNGITKGWEATLKNYQKNYPEKAAMGKLTMEILSLQQLSNEYIYVIGKWDLSREEGNLGGFFSLLWQEIDGQWLIVSDHSS
jgi:ketosteroid isomerase-like protein